MNAAAGPLAYRGLVEGFYGEPWSHEDRLRWFAFGGAIGLDHYLYAPKDDPWHRDRWREPYPAEQLASLAELNEAARRSGVAFVYAISPGLTMRFDRDEDHEALAAKCRQLLEAGIRSFALLFDDVPQDDPESLGHAHGDVGARFIRDFLRPAGIEERLLFCPTDYAGTGRTPYREGLDRTLPDDALVLWTGPDIVVGAITASDIEQAHRAFGRELVLWDNFPVNDFDRSRVFLGPLTGREAAPGLAGVVANPMVEAAPSRFSLSTVAAWAAHPSHYDPAEAAERAFAAVAGDADDLRTLVAACSAWPPDAPRWPALSEAVAGSRWEEVERLLADLAETDATGAPEDLAVQLSPWVRAARAGGRAGVLAARVLSEGAPVALDDLLDARKELESEFADVARATILALVDEAVVALGGEPARPARSTGAIVAVVTGPAPAPGDRELVEFLRAAGMRVELGLDRRADLLIVTRTAPESEAAQAGRLPIPLLTWGHLVALGLAERSAVPLSLDRLTIADPAHPIAGGLEGEVAVFRGRSKLTVAVPGEEAQVIAREPESGDAAIAITPAGARLADGRTAPAARASFFLATDGFAPWLVTDAARALLLSTVRELLDAPR